MRRVRFRDAGGMARTGQWTQHGIEFSGERYDPEDVSILPPSAPTKIICASKNNIDYAEEIGFDLPEEPLFCLKTPNTLTGHNDTVTLLPDKEIHFEGELGVVIGEQCRGVREEDAMDVVDGFTCANDMANHTNVDEYYVKMKAFDNGACVGPVIVPPEDVPPDAEIELRVNGEIRQQTTRNRYYFSAEKLISDLSEYMTLEPGDVILLGTPPGDAPLADGDTVEVEIEGVGTLKHDVQRR